MHALQPTIHTLHISQAFAGLVIVAIAGNAVENVAGIVLAAKGRAELAISVVKNSVAQIAAFLYPLLVLVSLLTATTLTFALAPVYIGALFGTARDRVADHRRRGGDGVRGGGADRHVRDPRHRGGVRDRVESRAVSTPGATSCYSYVYVRISFDPEDRTRCPADPPERTPHSAHSRRFGVHADHDSYKWWALSCTSLGMLLATINSGTLIIALPDLERSLHTSLLELVWVILVYMIASTVLVLSAGRLSDQFGRKKAYIGGFIVFAVGLAGRRIRRQRHGADPVADPPGHRRLRSCSRTRRRSSPTRSRASSSALAMGTNTMVAAVGLVIGPVLGGALVAISWHWVFWFNVPFGLAGSLWACTGPARARPGRTEDTRVRLRRAR